MGGGGGGPSSSLPPPPEGLHVRAVSEASRWTDWQGGSLLEGTPHSATSRPSGAVHVMRRSTSEGQHLASLDRDSSGATPGVLGTARLRVPLPMPSTGASLRSVLVPPAGGAGGDGSDAPTSRRANHTWNSIPSPLASAGSTGSGSQGMGDSASVSKVPPAPEAGAGDAQQHSSPSSVHFSSGGGLPLSAVGLATQAEVGNVRPPSRGGASSAFHSGGGVSSAFHSGEGVASASARGVGGSSQRATAEEETVEGGLRSLRGALIAPSMYDEGGLDESGLMIADSVYDSESGYAPWAGAGDTHSEGENSGSRRSTGVDAAMLAQILGPMDSSSSAGAARGVFANGPRDAPPTTLPMQDIAAAPVVLSRGNTYTALSDYKGRLAVNLGDLGDISQPDLERLLLGRAP